MFSSIQSYSRLYAFTIIGLIPLIVVSSPVERPIPSVLRPRQTEATPHPLDYAPDFSKDPFPPWPNVNKDDGSRLETQNWRGTKLFGWKGCEKQDQQTIVQTFNDFYTLAQQKSVWDDIDWDSQAAQEIWGHATDDRKKVLDSVKPQIKHIFEATQQIYNKNWWVPPYIYDPPWVAWRNLWIRVQCAPDGDESNTCGDKNPKCPGGTPPTKGKTSEVEAYSDNTQWYSKIVFCNYFFNGMRSLKEQMDTAKKNNQAYKNDLWNYQNRARTLFHEMTHLDYFMSTPDKSPYVDDVKIRVKSGKSVTNERSYGPSNVKILANYEAVGKGGYYTQRNGKSTPSADYDERPANQIYSGLIRLVRHGKVCRAGNEAVCDPDHPHIAPKAEADFPTPSYPTDPVQNQAPTRAPKGSNDQTLSTDDTTTDDSPEGDATNEPDHFVSGCDDYIRTANAVWGIATVNDDAKTDCDDSKLSGVMFNAMTNADPLQFNIYDKFCQQIDGTVNSKLTYDAHGNPKDAPKKKAKRTPPSDPDALNDYSFELSWETAGGDNRGCSQDVVSCRKAFADLTTSPCGHQGGQMNAMTSAAKITLPNCGTYAWLITGGDAAPTDGGGGGGGGDKPGCQFTGDPLTGGCKCSDGSTPARDEDNRCCLYNQPGGDQCFSNG
ncbi:uncharacterized protein KY384_003444 [Bacidia gigantensis]|uniref:uncharacterized protein n=1 Tax=Bacidia gigantensis TaxID=2732470 RepID=UPI001D04E134|nr:uncharacterized protein KY384_003444 [Bacidia gigantensis]KAG8531808.1 hypothetical protein KY384_003444 [Bacidia gigantensis]